MKEDSPTPAGARSEARQGRLQSLVREVMKEDSPTPVGERSEARQGRLQSLVRKELNEDFLFSSALRCRPMIVAGDDPTLIAS